MRASGRSTLLTTRITGSLASSALRRTKRVWGSGPSLASTSSSTPSTIVSPRSTSPPKSAWPGVSTMLSFTPRWRTAVFFARIVMPFSRSRSIESMTRSSTSWLARNAPLCHSIASTSVVFPWSTCAMIATLRRSSLRAGMRCERVEGPLDRPPRAGYCRAMGCILALLALISPRLVLFLLAIFSDVLSRAYDSWVIPLIGFFVLPWTTLTYAAFWDWGAGHHVVGFEWFFVILAFLIDLGAYGQGRRARYGREAV